MAGDALPQPASGPKIHTREEREELRKNIAKGAYLDEGIILPLLDSLDAMEKRLEAAEADTARLDYYEAHHGQFDLRKNNFKTYKWHWWNQLEDPGIEADTLRAAIDAARKEKP